MSGTTETNSFLNFSFFYIFLDFPFLFFFLNFPFLFWIFFFLFFWIFPFSIFFGFSFFTTSRGYLLNWAYDPQVAKIGSYPFSSRLTSNCQYFFIFYQGLPLTASSFHLFFIWAYPQMPVLFFFSSRLTSNCQFFSFFIWAYPQLPVLFSLFSSGLTLNCQYFLFFIWTYL